jgi:hypothetical protein
MELQFPKSSKTPQVVIEVVDNDFVHVQSKKPSSNIYSTKTINFSQLSSIFNTLEFQSPIFPYHVIKYNRVGKNISVFGVWNMPNEFFQHLYTDHSKQILLHYPYVYFLVQMIQDREFYVLTRNSIFVSYYSPFVEDHIFIPNIRNVYEDGHICWGNLQSSFEVKSYKPIDICSIAKNQFLTAIHNDDVNSSMNLELMNKMKFETYDLWKTSSLVRSEPKDINQIINL